MKLPTLRKLFRDDYDPEFQELIETMSPTVNNGVEVLYEALNNNLSLEDNIDCTVATVLLTVSSSGTPTTTSTFKLKTTDRILGVNVLSVENLTNSNSYPTGAPFISFSQSGSTITINHITGLIAGNNYRIRVVAYV